MSEVESKLQAGLSDAARRENARLRFAERVAGLQEQEVRVLREMLKASGLRKPLSVLRKSAGGVSQSSRGTANVTAALSDALEAEGVTAEALACVLSEGLAATRPVISAGKTRLYPDFSVRHKYLETAHKLRGDFPAAGLDVNVRSYEDRLSRMIKPQVIDIAGKSGSDVR